MERRDRAPWPALRRGRGARSLMAGPRAAAVAVLLILVLAGCWSEPPATPEALEAIPAGEEAGAGEEPPAEEGAGGEEAGGEAPQIPEQGGGGGDAGGGGASPGATPQLLGLGTPRATPRSGTPRSGTPPQIPLSNSTAGGAPTRAVVGVPTAGTSGGSGTTSGSGSTQGTGPRVPPLTVPDIQTAEAGGISVPPPIKTAVAEGTPITVPDLILTAEGAGIEVPPALQTAVAQGTVSAEVLALLTPSAGSPVSTDGTPGAEPTTEAGAPTDVPTEAPTEAVTATPPVTGSLLIVKTDDTGAALAGACFTLTATTEGGSVVGPLCDGDAGDGSGESGQVQFDNVVAGEYTLAETTAPEGFVAAESQSVTIGPGVIQIEVANAPVPSEVGSFTVALVDAANNPMVDEAGNALPDNCVTVEPSEGGSPLTVCDNGENDANPTAGIVQIDNLPAGDYVVRQDQAPAGFQPFAPFDLNLAAGQEVSIPAFSEPAAPEAGAVQVTMTDEAGALVAVTGGCVTLSGPAEPLQACDNLEGDSNPDPGVIDFQNVPAGDYVAVQVQPPDGFSAATATEQGVTVVANETAPVAFAHAAPAVEPTAAPEASPVVLAAPIAFLNAADEFLLLVPASDPAIQIGEAGTVNPDVAPAFSVDWLWLAFVSREPEGVFLVELETLTPQGPLDLGVAGRATGLTWSPSGATLAISVTLETGATDIVLIDPVAGNPGRVFGDTAAPASISALAWAPDGLRLVVVSTPAGGGPTVEIVDASTLQRTPVTVSDGIAADTFYGWSSTGRLLVGAGGELWIVDPVSRESVSLGTYVAVPLAPSWSADGSAVAFYDAPADDGGQLRIGELDGEPCETEIEDLHAMAWRPGTAELAVVGAREEGGIVLDYIVPGCTATTIEGPLDQPYQQIVWSADGNNLALISPPSSNNAREISLLSEQGLFPLQTEGIFVGGVFGWSPGDAESPSVLILYADPQFAEAPAEARLWAVPAESVVATNVQGATTEGGYVKNAWVAPRQVEATPEDPAPRRDPPPPIPGSDTSTAGGGGAQVDTAPATVGSIQVTSVDENGAAIPGTCVVLSGPVNYAAVCDGGEYDAAKDLAGVIRIEGITPGTYEVSEEPGPGLPAAPQTAEVVAGELREVTLPRGEPSETSAGTGQTGVSATWIDGNGAPLPGGCVQLSGTQSFNPVCDNDSFDNNPDPGVVLVLGIPAGDYTATETAPPGFAPTGEPQPVTVVDGAVTEIQFIDAPAA